MCTFHLRYIPVSDANPSRSNAHVIFDVEDACAIWRRGVQEWIALRFSVEEFFQEDVNLLVVDARQSTA